MSDWAKSELTAGSGCDPLRSSVEPNAELRAARESTDSPMSPGEHLSRAELAELVTAWIYEHRHRVVILEANYIGKLESWDFSRGGRAPAAVINGHLRFALGLLDRRCSPRVRPQLLTAVGAAVSLTGFMALDVLDGRSANRRFRYALSCYEEARDWSGRSGVLSEMARQSLWAGDLEDSLTRADYALVRRERLSPLQRSKLLSLRARSLAMMGLRDETLRTVAESDAAFEESRDLERHRVVAHYDAAEHAGETGHALADLAGDDSRLLEPAERRLQLAARGHGDRYARSRAFCDLRLAILHMERGDPRRGATIGEAALSDAPITGSARVRLVARDLYRAAQAHPCGSDVAAMTARLAPLAS